MSIIEHRLQLILDELRREQRVTVRFLSEKFAISAETVRRDLKELEAGGHARRIYGGAVMDTQKGDRPFVERLRVNAREKARIGAIAASLVKDGMTIFVDTGTTTLAFAQHMIGRRNVRILTNSIDIAGAFYDDPQANIRVLGGRLTPHYKALFGPETVTSLREHFFDLAVMGIGTVHIEHGFMDRGEDEAVLRRAARAQAKRSIMLADGSKFGRLGSVHTFPLDQIDVLVTDIPLAPDFAERFSQSEVEVLNA
ncbi:DeoR family transcriptional regulator [Skermanella stibiiresistens SB22]|uniref:DeoR family transcriptional regulator n=1 Tax=Skermanella stibiiresistens SB22 TaxID=1385369 RepID=W9GXC7_9PROT|nr:DeoR/GlpR family DNA-binding transcription regulator [Skermanella stibiiresistens]EWY38570.1 DeoR family transcriptional regulator [Skermanella stibiiresistens SB22]